MTRNDVTIQTMYAILKESVQRYPAVSGYECKQPQTFRVLQLDRGSELFTPAMGAKFADKDTPFFYSRSWERQKHNPNSITTDHPVLTAFELVCDIPKVSGYDGLNMLYGVEVSVLDIYRDKCDTRPISCENRTINQIYEDTEMILLNSIYYLSKCVIATVGDVTGVFNTDILDRWVSDGEISSYDIVHDIGRAVMSVNTSLRTVHVEMAANNVYGTKIRVNFPVYKCFDIEFGGLSCSESINQFQGC